MMIKTLIDEQARVQRATLERRAKRFGMGALDTAHAKLLEITGAFDSAVSAARADRRLTRLGQRDAITAAARAADAGLRDFAPLVGLRNHIIAIESELFAAPKDDGAGLATRADVERASNNAWRRAEIYRQIVGLDRNERELLARNTDDPDVAQVLNEGPPIFHHGRFEPLLPPEAKKAVQLAKAPGAKPEAAEKFDELQLQHEAIGLLVAAAREGIGAMLNASAETVADVRQTGRGAMDALQGDRFDLPAARHGG
jgi:hypothetical protein